MNNDDEEEGSKDDIAASPIDVDPGYVNGCVNTVASGENTDTDNGEDVTAGSNSRV